MTNREIACLAKQSVNMPLNWFFYVSSAPNSNSAGERLKEVVRVGGKEGGKRGN